jgi:PKD repeat protein
MKLLPKSRKAFQSIILIGLIIFLSGCKKKSETVEPHSKPVANFSFLITNSGTLPCTVNFTDSSKNANTYRWDFGDGNTSSLQNPTNTYTCAKIYNVKLIVSNNYGKDSIVKTVTIAQAKPKANFTFTISDPQTLPVALTCSNTSTGSNLSYLWSFGDGNTSTQAKPTHSYSSAGIFNVTLRATNASGTDSTSKQIKISPYPQSYVDINGATLNLYAWKGNGVMILSRNNNLNRATMFKWLDAMQKTYAFYKSCTGMDPTPYSPTFIDSCTTIADVPATCGAGCSYLGFTGIEMLNTYFDVMYNAINDNNQYDQVDFYEFGRNFWFYGPQLAYKTNDPITTGYAVFMRFMSMDAIGVNGAPFNSWTYATFEANVKNLIDTYLADPSLNWANTLGVGQGIANSGLGATDLFASFCFRLRRDYGGDTFVKNIWKNVALRPAATTTQDAVDNFVLAACATANKNLTSLFMNTWRWPVSASAQTEALKYP